MQQDDSIVQQSITTFWNTIASCYERDPSNVPGLESPEYEVWVQAIERMLPAEPSDVLDIGTGTGFVALIAGWMRHRVVGLDLSEAMLHEAQAQATRRGINVEFKVGDAVEPPIDEASVDVIICRHLLWTLRQPDIALENWHRILRPGGRIIVIDGFWFSEARPEEEFELFEKHYSKAIRDSLPAIKWERVELVTGLLRQAGFIGITADDLAGVYDKANHRSSVKPWYVVTGYREIEPPC